MKRTWLLRSSCTKSLAADSNYSNTIKCQEIIIFSHHILCLCLPFPVYTLKPYYMLFPLSRTLSPVFIPALTLLTYILVVVWSLSHVQLFVTSWTAAARLPCPSLSPRFCSNSCPLSQWCYLTISSSGAPFSFCLQSFQHQGLFQGVSSHQVAKVLELQLQHQSFQWTFRIDFL